MSARKNDAEAAENKDAETVEEKNGAESLIVEGPSGKKINLGRLVMGVGYTYKDGSTLSDEDKAFVDEELKRRTKEAKS